MGEVRNGTARTRRPARDGRPLAVSQARRWKAQAAGPAHPLSARQILGNPAGIALILSYVVLFAGLLYNLGLLFLFDVTLVSALTLADHVSTSVHVTFTLLALLVGFYPAAGLACFLGYLFLRSLLTGLIHLDDRKPAPVLDPASDPPGAHGTARSFGSWHGAGRLLDPMARHWAYLAMLAANGLLLLFVHAIAPRGIDFEGLRNVMATFAGLSLLIYFLPDLKRIRDFGPYTRFLGWLVTGYMLAFQAGVWDAARALGHVVQRPEDRPRYMIGTRGDEAHLLRAGSTGVFYLVRAETAEGDALLRFEPWATIKSLALVLPDTGAAGSEQDPAAVAGQAPR